MKKQEKQIEINAIVYTIGYIVEGEEKKIDDNEKVHKPLFENFPDQLELGNNIYAKRTMGAMQRLNSNTATKCSNGCSWLNDSRKQSNYSVLPEGFYVGDKIYCPKCFVDLAEQEKNKKDVK